MIYLDHNATTPLLPEVSAVSREWAERDLGNASSAHRLGRAARAAVETARRSIAGRVGAQAGEIIFTSGGTEGNNLALLGLPSEESAQDERAHFVAAAIEHSSIIRTLEAIERRRGRVTWLPLDRFGRVSPGDVASAIENDTTAVSVGWANNEIGTVQLISEIAEVCRSRGVVFHVDAVQALGKIPVDVAGIDLCTFSAHKIGGPKGVGALFVRRGLSLHPIMYGGSQERGLRPGTENVAGIVGFGVAAGLVDPDAYASIGALRDRLWSGMAGCAEIRRNSPAEGCLPNTLHVSFTGIPGEAIVAALDLEGIAVSAGSACAAGASEPSHVLRALGRSEREAHEGVRFSLGPTTTKAEVDATVAVLAEVLARVRGTDQRRMAHG